MTTLQDKTPEELNTICAELCGWHHFGCTGCACTPCRCNQWIRADDGPCELPPYATSYDAIMREIAKLTDEQLRQFDAHLCGILSARNYWDLWKSSPADLTRALILTLQSK